MIKNAILLVLVSMSLLSCIAHKDIVNFQGEVRNENKIKEINNQPYRLHVDDVLFIELKAADDKLVAVFKSTSNIQTSGQISEGNMYFTGYTVDKQGMIELPYLKKINVLGFTTDEVSQKIKDGLAQYILNPNEIFVSVKIAGFKYTILGEVGSSGTKVIYQNAVNVIEAVANAGDINITGDKKNIEIIRQGLDGVQKFKIDFTSISVFDSEVFYLQPNDIIYVPSLRQKTYGTGINGVQTLTTIISALSLITTTVLLIKNL